MDVVKFKRTQLEELASHRDKLRKAPRLRWLFFEITDRCNLHCAHCGSNCSSVGTSLTADDVEDTLKTIRGEKPMICLTGGEPTLHPEFFKIASMIRSMGFYWGMTTNGTIIDDVFAQKLKEAGMSTVSVSLDGLEKAHDLLRGQKGAWAKTLKGIRALQKAGFVPQVTTVFHKNNFNDIEPLYKLLSDMSVTSWRPINVEPIGRACESSDIMLTNEQFAKLLSFIRAKRFDSSCKMEVTFGCSHYLGALYERMVRDHYFLCGAGILTASVRANGDICACLDVEKRQELVQGNIRSDDFYDVWLNRFQAFRRDRTEDCLKCKDCQERFVCGGDSTHTWNFDKNEPLLCFKDFSEHINKNVKKQR